MPSPLTKVAWFQLDVTPLEFFPLAESWLVNSNFPRASRMQGEACKEKLRNTNSYFHFLPTSLVFEIVNLFSWIFNAISSDKSCLISTWRQDPRIFPTCWILIGQFKFPARQPYARRDPWGRLWPAPWYTGWKDERTWELGWRAFPEVTRSRVRENKHGGRLRRSHSWFFETKRSSRWRRKKVRVFLNITSCRVFFVRVFMKVYITPRELEQLNDSSRASQRSSLALKLFGFLTCIFELVGEIRDE